LWFQERFVDNLAIWLRGRLFIFNNRISQEREDYTLQNQAQEKKAGYIKKQKEPSSLLSSFHTDT
jgi:hypothetical protein